MQDSLSGAGKTLMFVNVAPTEADAGETVCTLNFASRVRGLELGPAKRHVGFLIDPLYFHLKEALFCITACDPSA